MKAPKRAYKRLTSESWAEIEAYWRNGTHTLEIISSEYGVTTRALQSHFQKHKIHKGENAATIAASAQSAVDASEIDDHAGRLHAFRAARSRTVTNADALENLLMAQIAVAQSKPEEAFRALATVKSIATAAQAPERLQVIRTAALGIETDQSDELPVIIIKDLTEDDLSALQRSHEQGGDDDDGLGDEEENEVLTYS